MLEQQLLAQQEREKRESFFIQRYERLLAWAFQITNQHVAGSEDLVHDAFIRFVLSKTKVEEIESLDGYFRSMLRYIYLTNRLRFAQRTLDGAISLNDCDSFFVVATSPLAGCGKSKHC
jgi:DNA-directed RNA polymerase specialized sigma24 family protein